MPCRARPRSRPRITTARRSQSRTMPIGSRALVPVGWPGAVASIVGRAGLRLHVRPRGGLLPMPAPAARAAEGPMPPEGERGRPPASPRASAAAVGIGRGPLPIAVMAPAGSGGSGPGRPAGSRRARRARTAGSPDPEEPARPDGRAIPRAGRIVRAPIARMASTQPRLGNGIRPDAGWPCRHACLPACGHTRRACAPSTPPPRTGDAAGRAPGRPAGLPLLAVKTRRIKHLARDLLHRPDRIAAARRSACDPSSAAPGGRGQGRLASASWRRRPGHPDGKKRLARGPWRCR